MSADDIELRRLELEAQEKREQRRAEMFKWFVAMVWPSILTILNAVVEAQTNAKIAETAETAARKSAAVAVKVEEIDKTVTDTNAVTAKWWAERTGDPDDMAKASAAQARAEEMQPASPAPNP